MPNKTENIKLNQWEPEDNFLRTDFNEDNITLERVLSALQTSAAERPKVLCGTYSGSYATNVATHSTIELGFRPKVILCVPNNGRWCTTTNEAHCGLLVDGFSGTVPLLITDTGFEIYNNNSIYCYLNKSGITYFYIALYFEG